ncbi:MAG: mycothiol synthase [Mycobacteriales bacterium]
MTATRPEARLEVSARLGPDEVTAVLALLDAVTEADGVSPLSEHVMLHLRYGGDTDARHILARETDEGRQDRLVGYGHIDPTDKVEGSAAELAVHPAARRHGVGRSIVARMIDESPDGRLRLWAHGQHPGASKLAHELGFERERILWQMRRSLFSPIPAPHVPDGIRLRTFVPGQDERAWTEVNNRAFAEHPDQGHWGIEEIQTREQEPWFDPAGFILAERDTGELVGFHWTKVHGGKSSHNGHVHEPIGEVYVVGVDPSARGLGLGATLTLAGLRHLRSLGLSQAMLYVDESNTTAIKLYDGLGFTRWDIDVGFVRG